MGAIKSDVSGHALACHGISRRFGAVQALDRADLLVADGTIHALVGENGAGKSTLMNIVSGLLAPDEGSVSVLGRPAQFDSPLDAVAAGIGMVHQHFLLAEALTVTENIALGMRRSKAGLHLSRLEIADEIRRLSADSGLEVDPAALIADLPVGLRQRVEILKALSRGARILLLDEPTAVLAPPEIKTLFATLRRLREEGRTIVVITHKLDEVFDLAESVTVLRKGKTVHAGRLSEMTPEQLAFKMVGQAPETDRTQDRSFGEIVLKAERLSHTSGRGTPLREASFSLRAGEVLGVAGVEGNGQDELVAVLAGTLAPEPNSEASLGEQPILKRSIRDRADLGLAVIPADRQRDGLVLDMTLAENLHLREVLSASSKSPIVNGPFLRAKEMENQAGARLEAFGVEPPEPARKSGELSGGNQQKVLIARELAASPKVIIAHNPTRGLDVAAASAVHQRLLDAARKSGAGVLLVSSDLDEVLELSDRVAVLYDGRLRALGERGGEKEIVGQAMVGA